MAVFALAVMATAPHAAASPEEEFLSALAKGGISVPAAKNQQVISGGHSVCSSWSSGASYADAVAGVAGGLGGNRHLAGVFVRAATDVFCPKYTSELP